MEKRKLIITYPWERFFDEIDEYFQRGNEDLDEEQQDQYRQARSFEKEHIFEALKQHIGMDHLGDSYYSVLEFVDYNYGSNQITDLDKTHDIERYLVRYPLMAFLNYVPLAVGLILGDKIELEELGFGKVINTEDCLIVEVGLHG